MTEEMQKAKDLFKEFCLECIDDERLKEIDWYDMSLGFFIALGLPIEQAEELACHVRYDENYWLG